MAQLTAKNLWSKLTAPHPSITNIEQRRQSQLLAALMLVLGITSSLAVILLRDSDHSSLIGSIIILTFLYFLNRSGRYRLSSNLFIGHLFLTIHLFPLVLSDVSWLFFTTMLMILSAILLSWRGLLVVFSGSVAAQIIIQIIAPQHIVMSNVGMMVIFLVTSPLLMVFIQHRNGLERERQAELRAANLALRESELSLEKRVTERTRDLQIAADVARQITTILDLNELLQAVVERTKAGFNLYHVSVFLLEADTQSIALKAGAGKAGEAMKAEGWHFSIGMDKGVVTRAAQTRAAVLINDVSKEANYLPNKHLPETRSELALPMVVGNQLVGVLDVQSESVNRFGVDDVSVMTTLAEQIAIAVNNANLYATQVQVAEQLREVDDLKSRFLASMSHELRTPLNAILNFTKFVSSGMLGPVNEKQVDALTKTVSSGQHLLSLINDVLDITKIEAKMLNLFIETDVDLHRELETVLAAGEVLLADKPVKLVREIAADLPIMTGDKRRIRQILLNLISNACKFTETGSVTVSAQVQDKSIRMFVRDTGPGIAPEDHDLIFESFRQTNAGLSQGGGTGLGLAIAKRLAEAHGGRLWLESEPGKGATFFVLLPIQCENLEVKAESPMVTGG